MFKVIRDRYYSIKDGVSNLIKWLPIIWSDRDWDQEYLYIIVHKKLEHMEEFFRSDNTFTAEAISVADEIKEAKDLLYNKINSTHTSKVDFDTREFIHLDNNKLNIDRSDGNYEAWLQSMNAAEIQETSDMKRSFDIIANKSKGWWD
ncbi:hypothetical protein ACH6EH_07100 [Paenibacillus sp. JSM ZJ436]|uniref:hypothetical protein n=1 Tax=Paenibacillus sp. JSM ZJ436 TaxID=3376190 RepID=UPI003797249E